MTGSLDVLSPDMPEASSLPSQPQEAISLEHSVQEDAEPMLKPQPEASMSQVRRLTPTECESLQGFPWGWTVPATEHLGTRSRSTSRSGSRKE